MAMALASKWSLVDIGVNLTDKMYEGVYNGRKVHNKDVDEVVIRAQKVGVCGLLVTGGNFKESNDAISLCKHLNTELQGGVKCLSTVGCHPTRCNEFASNPEKYLNDLRRLLANNTVANGGCVAAIGECGLDYDRLHFCKIDVQKPYFLKQFDLAEEFKLPMFLHDRNTGGDFYEIISANRHRFSKGVVHSFTGTVEDLQKLLELDLYIGVNGCSLKTEANLDAVRAIPLDRLLLETDGPWCELKNTHASKKLLVDAAERNGSKQCVSDVILSQFRTCRRDRFEMGHVVKSRCEPCHLVQVIEVVFELRKGEVDSLESLAAIVHKNTCDIFGF